VPRRDRDAEDGLVLDQRCEIEGIAPEQWLLLVLGGHRQCGEFCLVMHEIEGRLVPKRHAHRLAAAVAGERKIGFETQSRRRTALIVHHALQAKSDRAGVAPQTRAQSRCGRERNPSLDNAAAAREFEGIDPAARFRRIHREIPTGLTTLAVTSIDPSFTVRPIVLASSSPYRRELLARLHLTFVVDSPDVDETARAEEAPEAAALRLARAKACAVAGRHRGALVIGSDQVAELDGTMIGKPGAFDAALEQLERMQGRLVVFHTALALLDTTTGALQLDNVPTRVRFRTLARPALEAYLRFDAPFDCAGAAKIESTGIALVESVDSTDPTALVGLPLIRLTTMLISCGVDVPPR